LGEETKGSFLKKAWLEWMAKNAGPAFAYGAFFCLWCILRHRILHLGFTRWQGVNVDVHVPTISSIGFP
jgi:hypothetical protein